MDIYDYTTTGGKNLIMEYIGITAFTLLVTRQLYKKLWEIKISQERIMYVIQDQDSVYFLNVCKKQKGRAEKQELEKAKRRAKAAGLL